jgi:hypothetical protein
MSVSAREPEAAGPACALPGMCTRCAELGDAFRNRDSTMNELKVAQGLGWFSIGVGLTETVAGRQLGRAVGMEDKSWLLRAFGVREIAAGIAILAMDEPRAGMFGRVAGDVLDLAALDSGFTEDNPQKQNLAAASVTVAGLTALD